MKKFILSLLFLIVALSGQAKDPNSYRFGVDAGMVGNGYGFMVSPLQLQFSPQFQLGIGGIGFYNYRFQSNYDDVVQAAEMMAEEYAYKTTVTGVEFDRDGIGFYDVPLLIQLITFKFDVIPLTLYNKYTPFVKGSVLINSMTSSSYEKNSDGINVSNYENNMPSKLMGDLKLGLSLYSKHKGSNLSVYMGVVYGASTDVNNHYNVYCTQERYGNTVEKNIGLYDCGVVQLPMQFTFGLQFEFGGKGAWGYSKRRKQRSGNGWNNALMILSVVGEGLNVAGEIYGAVNNNQSSGGAKQSYSSQSSNLNNRGSSSSQSEGMTRSEMTNFNADDQAYHNYEKMLIKMSVYPEDYPNFDATRKEYQSKMKSLREKWIGKQLSINKSVWETKVF